ARRNGTELLRVDVALLQADLLFQRVERRTGAFERIAVRARIDLEQHVALLYRLVVARTQALDPPAYLRRDADRVRLRERVVSTRRRVEIVDGVGRKRDRGDDDQNSDDAPECRANSGTRRHGWTSLVLGHRRLSSERKRSRSRT